MSIWTDLWNLFFPHSCLLCGRQLISGERVLCLKCLSGLPRTQFHLRKDNIVECNFWGKIPVEHATSFLYYAKGGNVRQLLYELKYHGNQEVGEVMGRMMASELMCSHFFDGSATCLLLQDVMMVHPCLVRTTVMVSSLQEPLHGVSLRKNS